MVAILGHGLLDDVSSMVERLYPMTVYEFVDVGIKMLVLMEPNMDVDPKCCLLLHAMDRINASAQAHITQQLVVPHVEAFSSILVLCIDLIFIWIKVVVVVLLQLLLSGVRIRLLGVCVQLLA